MDFTINKYKTLIKALLDAGYNFKTVSDFLDNSDDKTIILRHDVEKHYQNALQLATIQCKNNIKGTFYFRILDNHFDSDVIKRIAEMGHEIGYHYDDLSFCGGNYEKAIHRFEKNLNKIREYGNVLSICMEGAPMSKYDNRKLWDKYDYKKFGIKSEPYFSLDFDKILYLTDTGRSWSGKFSVRDKSIRNKEIQQTGFRTTNDIISEIKSKKFPKQAMLTFHPQRWHDKSTLWLREFILQNIKNQFKKLVISTRG